MRSILVKINSFVSTQNTIFMIMFILFLSYALFLLEGLPFYMYGYDDLHLIYQTVNLSLTDLVQSTFFDTLSLEKGFIEFGIYQRPVHGLFLKLSYLGSGMDPSFYYILRALFFAITGILVYLFTKKIVNSNICSMGAAFLYCSLPVVYDGLRYIGAAESFSQFFLLLGIYIFVKYYSAKKMYVGKQKYFSWVILFLLGLFNLKLRETGVLMPAIIGCFLILKHKDFNKNKIWWLPVVILSLYLLPAVFSIIIEDNASDSIKITPEKIMANAKYLLFFNHLTKTGTGEQVPVIFSLKQYLSETPGSLLGSLGFFLAWYLIAMLCTFFYSVVRKNKLITSQISKLSSDYFTISLVWFILSILLMVLYVREGDHHAIRYIGEMMLPAILIIIPFCYHMSDYIKKLNLKCVSKHIMTTFLILIFLSVVVNASITGVYRRGGIGSRHIVMEKSAQTIVEDLYNQPFDNSFFFAMTEISGDGRYIPCKFSTNISLADVAVTNDPFLSIVRPINDKNIQKSLSKYGFVYIVSSSELPADKYPRMQLVKEIHSCEGGESYYCRTVDFLKHQKIIATSFKELFAKEPRFFVYKIVKKNILYEKPVRIICADGVRLPQHQEPPAKSGSVK